MTVKIYEEENEQHIMIRTGGKKYIINCNRRFNLFGGKMASKTVRLEPGETIFEIGRTGFIIAKISQEYCVVLYSDDNIKNTVIVSLLEKVADSYYTMRRDRKYTSLIDTSLFEIGKPKECKIELGEKNVNITLGRQKLSAPLPKSKASSKKAP